jgi:GxxExxY protein
VASEDLERIVNTIIGCAIEVHRHLGPGLLESVYRECLLIELRDNSFPVESELRVPIIYKTHRANTSLKLDLLVADCVVIELKAIEQIHTIHLAQVITYLKLANYPVGLLMNFNVMSLRSGLRRLDHPDRYSRSDFSTQTS